MGYCAILFYQLCGGHFHNHHRGHQCLTKQQRFPLLFSPHVLHVDSCHALFPFVNVFQEVPDGNDLARVLHFLGYVDLPRYWTDKNIQCIGWSDLHNAEVGHGTALLRLTHSIRAIR